MRLPKPHSHTSERLGYEARKNVKKINWRNTQDAMIRQTTVQNLPADRQRGGGRERQRKAIERKRMRYDKGNQRQNPPAMSMYVHILPGIRVGHNKCIPHIYA